MSLHHSLSRARVRRDPARVGRLAPPSWPGFLLGLFACIAYVFQWDMMGSSIQLCRSEQFLVFLAISWGMTEAQLDIYLLLVSSPFRHLEVDVVWSL